MQRRYLLPEAGQLYKANMHAHTTISDGKLSPEELKKAYMDEGYSIVAYTDHRRYINHTELNEENRFLALAALETDISAWPASNKTGDRTPCYHFNFYDLNPNIDQQSKQDIILPERRYDDINYINAYIDYMYQKGFICCYNHPYWSLQTVLDYNKLRGCFAMEIYNHGCEIDGLYGYNPQSYDEMLRAGSRLYCFSTDDNHNVHPNGDLMSDSFGGYIQIKADALNYESIMKALVRGDFYSCVCPTGATTAMNHKAPEITELYMVGRTLCVTCSPVEKIYVITEGRRCHTAVAKPGETITTASFTLEGNEGYIRVDCRDEKGYHALSNAYFIDELTF